MVWSWSVNPKTVVRAGAGIYYTNNDYNGLFRLAAGLPNNLSQTFTGNAFTPQIPLFFQEFGFCSEGEGAAYATSAACPPDNTSGGGLSEAYVHGFNLIVEGVRQVRGTSTSQTADVDHCLVTGGNVVPTGALVLSKEPW